MTEHKREASTDKHFSAAGAAANGKTSIPKISQKRGCSLTWSRRQRWWHQIIMSPSKMYSKSKFTVRGLGIMNVWANNESLFMKIALCLQSHSAVLVRGLCAICSLKKLPASDSGCGAYFVHMKLAVLYIRFVFLQPHHGGLFLPHAVPECIGSLRN